MTDSDLLQWATGAVRLSIAVVLAGAIGIDRELRQKPAGMRTHALVALGAAAVMVLTEHLATPFDPEAASRAIQGILTGVGFLGAGVILHRNGDQAVTGLTTAATIWIAAALGTACGLGEWAAATVATVLTLLILTVGEVVESAIHRRFARGERTNTSQ
jgi:putative Mg2+ transporter-C (MgtC) family protein